MCMWSGDPNDEWPLSGSSKPTLGYASTVQIVSESRDQFYNQICAMCSRERGRFVTGTGVVTLR
jgi:hypothetical protein